MTCENIHSRPSHSLGSWALLICSTELSNYCCTILLMLAKCIIILFNVKQIMSSGKCFRFFMLILSEQTFTFIFTPKRVFTRFCEVCDDTSDSFMVYSSIWAWLWHVWNLREWLALCTVCVHCVITEQIKYRLKVLVPTNEVCKHKIAKYIYWTKRKLHPYLWNHEVLCSMNLCNCP